MVGAGLVQPLERLIDYLHLGTDVLGLEQFHHLGRYLVVGEGGIDVLHVVHHLLLGQVGLRLGLAVGGGDDVLHVAVAQQLDGRLESDELAHAGHVDAVVVGVAHLRRRADDDNLLRVQAVQNADDALPQGGAAHDGVVDDDEVVHARIQTAVGDVIDVGGQVVTRVALGNERA